jgi:hypothetical protein
MQYELEKRQRIKVADGVILVYAINSKQSFHKVEAAYQDVLIVKDELKVCPIVSLPQGVFSAP